MTDHRGDNLRGGLYMVIAMAGFAFEDMFLKAAAATGMPVGQILMLFGLGGTLGFVLLTLGRREPLLHPAMRHRAVFLRAGAEVTGRVFFTLALGYGALSTTSAILQAAPLVVVAGAALILHETVGWRRWGAILVGFAGVLMILRPASDATSLASFFALLGMLGFAGRDLATRSAPRAVSNLQLGVLGFAVLGPTGTLLAQVEGGLVVPTGPGLGFTALATLVGIGAYTALTLAMRIGEVSFVTPFRYSRLLFGIGLGVIAFGERPDGWTLIGSAVILAAGLYTMLRDKRRRPGNAVG